MENSRFNKLRERFGEAHIDYSAELPHADNFEILKEYLEAHKSGRLLPIAHAFFDVLVQPDLPDREKLIRHLQTGLAIGKDDLSAVAVEMQKGWDAVADKLPHTYWQAHETEIKNDVGQAYAALAVNAQRAGNKKFEQAFETAGLKVLTSGEVLEERKAPTRKVSRHTGMLSGKRMALIMACLLPLVPLVRSMMGSGATPAREAPKVEMTAEQKAAEQKTAEAAKYNDRMWEANLTTDELKYKLEESGIYGNNMTDLQRFDTTEKLRDIARSVNIEKTPKSVIAFLAAKSYVDKVSYSEVIGKAVRIVEQEGGDTHRIEIDSQEKANGALVLAMGKGASKDKTGDFTKGVPKVFVERLLEDLKKTPQFFDVSAKTMGQAAPGLLASSQNSVVTIDLR